MSYRIFMAPLQKILQQINDALNAIDTIITSLSASVATLAAAPLVLQRDIADTTVASSAAETAIFSCSVSNLSFNGRTVILEIAGTYLFNNAGKDTTTLRVKFGATTVATSIVQGVALSATTYKWFARFVLTSRSTSAQQGNGFIKFANINAAYDDAQNGTAAINTGSAGNTTFQVTAQHSASSANLSITKTTGVLVLT